MHRPASDRKEQIRSIVHQRGLVRNSELSNLMGVSTVTIRQDLEQLESRGLLRRTYGGAAAIAGGTADSAFSIRSAEHSEAKRRIGAAAAAMISAGQTIVLDAGTTTIEIARQLPADLNLTVVTCAWNIAVEASSRAGVQVILCGGLFNPKTLSVVGSQVEHVLQEIDADRLFLATYAVNIAKGLCERNLAGAQTKRALIRCARQVVLVCDSSKFGAVAPMVTAPISAVDHVVTDRDIPRPFSQHFRKRQIAVTTV
jgi:DeoR/GlpR family transcriptional regulator of sugar metabolism